MSDDTISASFLEARDFLSAFDLDHVNIQDINVYHDDGNVNIHITLNTAVHKCPICNAPTSKIKGYTTKYIRHSVLTPSPCNIVYRARRYICPVCGKTFYEHNPFAFKHTKVSVATVYNVLQELKRPEATFTSVGEKFHLSPSSVATLFDKHIQISRRTLPLCLSLDETYAFKSDGSDYICVLLDYLDKKIVDILPSRKKQHLSYYFHDIPIEERKKVKYISFDMWETYRAISKQFFPWAYLIVDKFHVLQELQRRVTRVRIRIMNENKKIKDQLEKEKAGYDALKEPFPVEKQEKLKEVNKNYYLLKKFNFVLFSNNKSITDPNIEKKYNRVLNMYSNLYDIYDMLMGMDEKLTEAINIKDEIHKFYKTYKYEEAKKELERIIIRCRTSNVIELQIFADTLIRWKQEIINSFLIIPGTQKRLNNGLIENRNKSIKLLKHSSNGYTNWSRFRNRVLYTLNDDTSIKI